MTAIGFVIRDILILSILALALVTDPVSSQAESYCVLNMVQFIVMDIVVFWPTLLRMAYVRRVKLIIECFYSDTDEHKARTKQRRSFALIFIVIGVILIYQVVFIAVIIIKPDYRQAECTCTFTHAFNIGQAVSFVVEIVAYFYFMGSLCSLRSPLKYKIKQELQVLGSCWVLA